MKREMWILLTVLRSLNMEYIVVLGLLITCPDTKVVNTSKLEWTVRDTENLNIAKTRCRKIYQNSPCLKLFNKRSHLNYWAICGGANASTQTR